jgi:hypothetical protein
MKAAVSFASVTCLFAALAQPVVAQSYWQASPNCAPVLSYSSATAGPPATYYAGSGIRTPYVTCAPPVSCAAPPVCAPPVPKFREQIVTEIISVPETVMEKRTIEEQQIRYEQRPRTVTVYDQVPQTVNVNETVTVMTQETRMQQVTQTGYQAVPRNVVTPVTVAVQGFENRVGIRQVAQNVPVTVNRVVTSQCACTQSSPGMASVQAMSQPAQQIVQQVVNQQRIFNQQYTYQVPVTRQQVQYQTQQVVDYRPVSQTVNVPVAVQVPRQQVQTRQVTQMTTVPRQVTTYETVAVPCTVSREIEVPVTRYVQKTIQKTVQVPVIEGCSSCNQ